MGVMNSRGIYIHVGSDTVYSGVNKKIQNQIKIFSSHFEMKEIIIRKSPTNPIKSIGYRLPFGSFGREYEAAKAEIEAFGRVDFFYIRNIAWDRKWCNFISWMRRTYPDSKILLELPTYPYGRELLSSPTMWPWFFKDKRYIRKAKNYVDKVVTYSNDSATFGVSAINVMNGIIVDDIDVDFNEDVVGNDGTIRLLAIAQFQPAHGYERIIRSLYNYFQLGGTRDIVIDFVGYGDVVEKYKKMVDEYGLKDRVFFYGMMEQNEIKEIAQTAQIGLSGFASYRQGIDVSSSLKVREYLAYGLPVVSGSFEDILEEDGGVEFYLRFPNDDSDISMEAIISFFDELRNRYPYGSYRQVIRDYAKENADMSVTLKPILSYLGVN